MKLSQVKILLMASALLLSACSGVTTSTCFSEGCRSFDSNTSKLNMGGTALGNSFNQYSSGLLHD
jgi:uncharacterized protein YceK